MRVVDLALDGASRGTTFAIATAIDPVLAWRGILPDADGRRILTADAGLHLRDGATGEPIAALVEGAGTIPALFLADGRIVVQGRSEAQPFSAHPRLWVFDRVGTRLAELELPLQAPGSLGLGPEVAPGRVVVSSYRGWLLAEDALVVDVANGEVEERLAAGLRPASGFQRASPAVSEAGSSVHFFMADEGRGPVQPGRRLHRVVRIDFATGERKVVAGPGAARGQSINER
jgi:hypothetical protein